MVRAEGVDHPAFLASIVGLYVSSVSLSRQPRKYTRARVYVSSSRVSALSVHDDGMFVVETRSSET